MRVKQRSIQIRGERWRYAVYPDSVYERKFDSDSDALTFKAQRKLCFKESRLKLGVVIHEVFHAHCVGLYLDSTTSMSTSDVEEIIAEMLEDHLSSMLKISKYIKGNLVKDARDWYKI